MRSLFGLPLAATALAFLLGQVGAEELPSAAIIAAVSGQTAYLETTASSVTGTAGHGVIFYNPDGTGLYKTPMGVVWHGTWAVKDNLFCSKWNEGPTRPCLKFDKQGDTINLVEDGTGNIRAKILKLAPGNAENLKP